MLRIIKQNIPNTITCLNLLCGSMATVAAFNGEMQKATLFIFAAAIFDFFDGFAARILKAYSPMGKELDSLADLISFGFAPSMMLYTIIESSTLQPQWLSYISFLLVVFSALRLAKFNVDERQTSSFIGMPTPANALFWITLLWSYSEGLIPFELPVTVILALVPIFCYLLVSEIPMFSLKIKSMKFAENRILYIFLAGFVTIVAVFGVFGIALGILFYIILSYLTAERY
ncbi:MAG: CDP-diacylglycerol--serine O-phosphatidyltransferase [Bacteroidales bacterium]